MLYLYLDTNRIKILHLKKTLLGQHEASFFQKKHEIDLLEKGKATNIDVLASAIKEGTTQLGVTSEKQVFLILPQESFSFLRTEVPKDLNASALSAFIQDKVRTSFAAGERPFFFDSFVKETDKQKHVTVFAVEETVLTGFAEALRLLGLKVVGVLPESLAYFKLFEKTLRADKKENIFYVTFDKDSLLGYLYDSGGLVLNEGWRKTLTSDKKLEEILKAKVEEFKEKGKKLNRVILSGEKSTGIRQDTFTKDIGVWTNPLKRIIPTFYQDYIKQLVVPKDTPFPLLAYDVCFGAFVFAQENKDFQILKKPFKAKGTRNFSFGGFPLFRREVLIFLVSAIVSFGAFLALSKTDFSNFKLPNIDIPKSKQTVKAPVKDSEKKATPTSAPRINKEELKIKVLNGSGEAGKASDMKDALTEAGYQEIITGNAETFDFEQTVIQVKEDFEAAGDVLAEDLKDSVEDPKIETLEDEDEASDVIIIVGTDFK